MTYQETKECRPTQIETEEINKYPKETNKYEENAPEEQEIQECDYTNT